jgi:hypothetical protein
MEGYSSILTREDVLHLLDCLEVNGGEFEITDEMVSELSSNVTEALSNEGTDIVSDYELTMSYREVELDSIDLNEGKIRAAVRDAIEAYIDNNKADA